MRRTGVPDQPKEEKDSRDTNYDDDNEANDSAWDSCYFHARDECDQQAESAKPAEGQEWGKPVTFAVLVRSASDERDENDELDDNVANDLSPSAVRSESNDTSSCDNCEDEWYKPEKVESLAVRTVQHPNRVKPSIRCIE